MHSLRVLFVVQGEGRGHMTQALALQQILEQFGHHLVKVVVVTNPERTVPSFFLDKIGAPVTCIEGPGFVVDRQAKAVKPAASILSNLRDAPRFLEKAKFLHEQVEEYRPDLILNFYDLLPGLMSQRFRSDVPIAAVGHQYLFLHSHFSLPPGRRFDRWMFQAYTRATALGSDLQLALSLYPLASYRHENLTVVPPLLRREVFEQPLDRSDGFLLVYLLSDWYVDEIIDWHERHPEVEVHCFWDRTDVPAEETYSETLTFHQLDDEKFLDLMARSTGVATTAGFESVCEAMYLDKPVYMVPMDGHFEQYCNAFDACRAEAGIRGTSFNLSPLLRYRKMRDFSPEPFRAWVEQAPTMVMRALESTAVL